MPSELWSILFGWLYTGFVLVLVGLILLRKREVHSAVSWSLVVVTLPVLGPFLFLLAGWNRAPRHLLRKTERAATLSEQLTLPAHACDGAVATRTDETARWSGLAGLLRELGEGPCRPGHAADLFTRGTDAFEAMCAAIAAARHSVHVEFYIFRDDALGQELIRLLCRKAREGVAVRLLVDGMGSLRGWRLLRQVRRDGGETASFLPLFAVGKASPNLRNHRKLVVCDGEVAFFGGLNVGVEYLGRLRGQLGRFGRRLARAVGAAQRVRARDWYDLHMRLRGPAVQDLQLLFVEDWHYAAGALLDDPALFPPLEPAGDATAQVIAGGPDVDVNAIHTAMFVGITRARRRVRIASPYLAPDPALCTALMAAARGGVQVDIVTQGRPPDSWLAYFCGIAFADRFANAGVRVHSYPHGMMHAKAIAVDGEWAMLGTANFDYRSTYLNFEQMTCFEGDVATEIDTELERLVARSEPLDRARLDGRGTLARGAAAVARLFAPLL